MVYAKKTNGGKGSNITSHQVMMEMFSMVKSSTDTTHKTISMLQSQTEKIAGLFLEQYSTFEVEGRTYLEEWMTATKKSQVELKKLYSQGMDRIAELIIPKLEWEFEFDQAGDVPDDDSESSN